jgi:hypothetical protein
MPQMICTYVQSLALQAGEIALLCLTLQRPILDRKIPEVREINGLGLNLCESR